MSNSSEPKRVPFYVPWTAALLNGFITAPLELASTRSKSASEDRVFYATRNLKHTKSVKTQLRSFKLIKHVYQTEGARALWRGSSWFIIGNACSRSLWLTSYNHFMELGQSHNLNHDLTAFGSGFLAGGVTALLSNPIWTLKSYAQLPNYPGFIVPTGAYQDTLEYRKRVLKFKVLMAGVKPALVYVPFESAFHLYLYDYFKRLYSRTRGEEPSPLISGFLSGLARISILPASHPFHVMTLRCREFPDRKISQIYQSVKAQKAWYHGSIAYIWRVIPQSALLFFTYEAFKKIL